MDGVIECPKHNGRFDYATGRPRARPSSSTCGPIRSRSRTAPSSSASDDVGAGPGSSSSGPANAALGPRSNCVRRGGTARSLWSGRKTRCRMSGRRCPSPCSPGPRETSSPRRVRGGALRDAGIEFVAGGRRHGIDREGHEAVLADGRRIAVRAAAVGHGGECPAAAVAIEAAACTICGAGGRNRPAGPAAAGCAHRRDRRRFHRPGAGRGRCRAGLCRHRDRGGAAPLPGGSGRGRHRGRRPAPAGRCRSAVRPAVERLTRRDGALCWSLALRGKRRDLSSTSAAPSWLVGPRGGAASYTDPRPSERHGGMRRRRGRHRCGPGDRARGEGRPGRGQRGAGRQPATDLRPRHLRRRRLLLVPTPAVRRSPHPPGSLAQRPGPGRGRGAEPARRGRAVPGRALVLVRSVRPHPADRGPTRGRDAAKPYADGPTASRSGSASGPDGRLVSAAAIGPGNAVAKDIRLAEMLIAAQAEPDPAALTDPAVPLKTLLRAHKVR